MRIFIAINPTAEERDRLSAASRPLREAAFPVRWLPPENVHLTLKFLGAVEEARLPELSAALDAAAAGTGAFDMPVGGFGAFPSLRRPGVVWVGIEAPPALRSLEERVEDAMAELGFPREDRAFRPHLTIGRSRKRVKPADFRGLEELVGRLEYSDEYRVRAVEVMSSRLMPSGAIYDVVHMTDL